MALLQPPTIDQVTITSDFAKYYNKSVDQFTDKTDLCGIDVCSYDVRNVENNRTRRACLISSHGYVKSTTVEEVSLPANLKGWLHDMARCKAER